MPPRRPSRNRAWSSGKVLGSVDLPSRPVQNSTKLSRAMPFSVMQNATGRLLLLEALALTERIALIVPYWTPTLYVSRTKPARMSDLRVAFGPMT